MFDRDGLGSFVSRFEGRARKEETGDDLDSVGAVLVEGACLESLACFFLLTIAFPVRDFELDAAPELGAQDVASTTAWDLVDESTVPVLLFGRFWTSMSDSDDCRFLTCVASFDEVWETAVAVSLRESAL